MHHRVAIGYSMLTLAQITISINVVTSKYLLASMPMFLLLSARFGMSSLILALLLKLSKTPLKDPNHPQGRLTHSDWVFIILQGIFAAFLFNVFFVWGLQFTTATAAGIIGATLPAMIAVSAVFLLKERLKLATILALVLAMIGILVINLESNPAESALSHTYFGDFLILLAMVPEAWYSILGRKIAGRVTPLGAAFIANLVGFLTLLPCAILADAIVFTVFSWHEIGLVCLAAMSSLFFFCAWGWGLTFIPASTAAIFGGVMPVSTAFLAIIFLGETFSWYDTLGMLIVISSIIIGTNWRNASLTKIELKQT